MITFDQARQLTHGQIVHCEIVRLCVRHVGPRGVCKHAQCKLAYRVRSRHGKLGRVNFGCLSNMGCMNMGKSRTQTPISGT